MTDLVKVNDMVTVGLEVNDWETFDVGQRGTYMVIDSLVNRHIHVYNICPGCGQKNCLVIGAKNVDGTRRSPTWDIVQRSPLTLSPSINHQGCWHGHLKDGNWVEC